tara:strand:- start:1781 stop:2776 length:996 start_codon:yes stop_codon:yes gene_type:complete
MIKKKNLGLILIVLIFSFIFLFGSLLSKKVQTIQDKWTIAIPKNSDLSEVSSILSQNTNVNPLLFKISMYMTFNQNNIKYGRYDFRYIKNMRDLVYTITSSSSMKVKVTIPEGLKMQEVALLFEKTMNLDVEKFMYLCYDKKIINSLNFGFQINNLEGFLYPDTYIFLKTYNEKDVIKILIENFKNKFNLIAVTENNLNLYDTIILASIIQAESKYRADMDTISSVFHNRLRDNEKLEADPTIQYLLPVRKKRLMYKDIEEYKNSPYNTYKNKGLPPTPINSPGIKAISAALNPPKTNYKFFVADGKGTHVFNTTIKGHNKSKNNVFRKFK